MGKTLFLVLIMVNRRNNLTHLHPRHRLFRFGLANLQNRQKQRSQNPNNRNDDEQFD